MIYLWRYLMNLSLWFTPRRQKHIGWTGKLVSWIIYLSENQKTPYILTYILDLSFFLLHACIWMIVSWFFCWDFALFSRRDDEPRISIQIGEDDDLKQKKQFKLNQISRLYSRLISDQSTRQIQRRQISRLIGIISWLLAETWAFTGVD